MLERIFRRGEWRMRERRVILPAALSVALACAALTCGRSAVAEISGDTYTAAQAAQGREAFIRYCADCHHSTLRGSGHGPPLVGPAFLGTWRGRKASELYAYARTRMAATVPASTTEDTWLAMVAYVLERNGVPPSDKPLTAGSAFVIEGGAAPAAAVAAATQAPAGASDGDEGTQNRGDGGVVWGGADSIMAAAVRAGRFVNREAPPTTPVTDEMLRNPPPGDWINWRGTQSAWGYSPLKQITPDNVGRLRLAWALTMREGSNQPTPLVHEGIMYLTHSGNVIQALEAATGELIWEYSYPYPPESKTLGGPTRNIALYDGKLFMTTYDAALVAIDARTGKQLWRAVKADWREGYTHTAGPVVADGVVVSGISGCERFKEGGCFITGHDPDTGKELWRTSTIALPGDPNDRTWAGLPPYRRAGSDNWIAGTYDPELKLFILGTSQAKPWVAASRGMSPKDAALYTNSTLALDPKTGRIRWYFQHVPGETLDMETAFERVLIDVGGTPAVFTAGKDGLLWKLDRRNGRFIDVVEMLPQNLFEKIDRRTGRVRYRADIINARIDDTISVCPSIYGGKNWQAMAYSPETGLLIIPLHQLCVEMTGRSVDMNIGGGGYGGESRVFHMPGVDGQLGRLSAYDVATLERKWTHTQRAMFMSGVLTTASGLAFVGDLDRWFQAFDVRTGKILWRTRLGSAAHGFPISYEVNGRQFIAVPAGLGVFKLMTAEQSPEIYQPSGGNMLYVFELAD